MRERVRERGVELQVVELDRVHRLIVQHDEHVVGQALGLSQRVQVVDGRALVASD